MAKASIVTGNYQNQFEGLLFTMNDKLKPLLQQEIETFCSTHQWSIVDGQLTKIYKFRSYLAGVDFIQHLAAVAEELNHHPDILLSWRKVSVSLVTHDANNSVTQLDTNYALQSDKLYSSHI